MRKLEGEIGVGRLESILKFGIIGGSSKIINMVLLFILTSVAGLHYMLSAFLIFLYCLVYQYTGHNWWTFVHKKSESHIKSVSKFALVLGIYNAIYFSSLFILTDVFGIYYMISAIVAVIVLYLPHYWLNNTFVWKEV